jgi:hypothetical protein
MANWKGFGRKRLRPNRDTNPVFVWRDWENPWEISVRITGIPAEIRTEHLPEYTSKVFPLHQHLRVSSRKSFSTFSNYLNLGLPNVHLPSGLLSEMFVCLIRSNYTRKYLAAKLYNAPWARSWKEISQTRPEGNRKLDDGTLALHVLHTNREKSLTSAPYRMHSEASP